MFYFSLTLVTSPPSRGFRQTDLIIVIFEAAEIASHIIP